MRRLLSILLLLAPVSAQDDLRFLSATSFHDAGTGTNYAYMVWQAEKHEHLRGLNFEVYAKSGNPSSPAPFTRRGRMSLETNTSIISALLDSAPEALVDPAQLEERIDGLFGSLLPDAGLDLAMKISGILQIAETDPNVHRRLVFFSRTHPFLGIVMGTGGVFPLSSTVTTFELRSVEHGAATVGARVTLDLASPPNIPAPGPPVHVTDEAPSGHLNAKIRWGIPAALARRTALTYGYNLYRMDPTFATSNGYDSTPPTPSVLTGLLDSNPGEVTIVNQVPVMPTASLSPAEAADLVADPESHFITDDNGVILDGGTPFSDGDQFYYFVAARDLLGRPGDVSDGTLITFCDRQRPHPPIRTRVEHIHDGSAAKEDFLRVSWEAPTTGDTPDHYLVYRWANPQLMVDAAAATPFDPSVGLVSGIIPHDPATTRYTFDDDGSGSPKIVPGSYRTTGDDGKTYWYSVRAVKNTTCGALTSGNSSPGWGVLRDRFGPGAAGASSVIARRNQPDVTLLAMTTRDLLGGEAASSFSGPGDHYVLITVTRIDPRIEGAILYRYTIDSGNLNLTKLGSKLYSTGDDVLEVRLAVDDTFFSGDSRGIIAMARDQKGRTAYDFVTNGQIPSPDNGRVAEVPFEADVVDQSTTVTGGGVGDDPIHTAVDVDTGTTNPIEVTFDPSNDAEEYKLYKRIDGGPLLLVDQGEVVDPAVDITIDDEALPANSSQVCYFVQYFDEHGNPSPLADLGCVQTTAKVDMPVPILARPEKAGTDLSPQVTLRWFSETQGVERFRIYIDAGDTGVPITYSSELSIPSLAVVSASPLDPFAVVPSYREPSAASFEGTAQGFTPYLTGRVGGNFGDPATPNQFEITLNVASGHDYQFYIESVSPAGDQSDPSNTEDFTWTLADAPTLPEVPWPARALPPVDDAFIPDVEALYLENNNEDRFYAVVKIGEITGADLQSGVRESSSGSEVGQSFRIAPYHFTSSTELKLYTSAGGETALPFVLYRHQVANEFFPNVSGDVVQVSPRIDRVRTVSTTVDGAPIDEIVDPFFELLWDPDDEVYAVCVKDTQGVIRGSTYKYVLLRFKDNGEIDRSFPTNELFIPFVDP